MTQPNLTILASELAALVPAMALDSSMNNAHLIQGKLEDAYRSIVADRDSWEACCKTQDALSPCGHKEQYAHSDDGGRTIYCYVCQLGRALEQLATLRAANHLHGTPATV